MSDGQLTRPGVLHLATKRLLLRTLRARVLADSPGEAVKAAELLTDTEYDLLRLHQAEAELVQLKLRLGGIKGAAIAHTKNLQAPATAGSGVSRPPLMPVGLFADVRSLT